jgi:peroxiredoxin
MEQAIYNKYKDQDVIVWGIGAEDGYETLKLFAEQMGLSYPILYDQNAQVKANYNPGKPHTNSAYPQDWIVGVDGTIVYVNTEYEPDEMAQIIEAELAK